MKRRLLISLIIVSVSVGGWWWLQLESYYAKQTIGERIWRTFSYAADNQLALVNSAIKNDKTFLLDVPMYRQEKRLTCEVAALRMALGHYLVDISEDELLRGLAFDTKQSMMEGVWGNPESGFVGDPDGSFTKRTGYGVHQYPIRDLAREYRPAEVLMVRDVQSVANIVSAGKPVLVWMVFSGSGLVHWDTYGGSVVEAHPGEHVRVVVGFVGESSDPKKFILYDPIYGRVTLSVKRFAKEWAILGNKAVVLN